MNTTGEEIHPETIKALCDPEVRQWPNLYLNEEGPLNRRGVKKNPTFPSTQPVSEDGTPEPHQRLFLVKYACGRRTFHHPEM